ncbi:MAG TPA: hypothetical protein VFN37_03460 [Candidatus Baltobacteraceae bacterium]|nr:hypothetical protein [Candidatus Baltobacteraceae bacterium]
MSRTLQYKVYTMLALLKKPSGFLPVAIPALLLALILDRVARAGTLYQPDEGAGAHLFQILMPVQFLIVLFFAIRRLPERRSAALEVLALQIAAALAVFALVHAFHG